MRDPVTEAARPSTAGIQKPPPPLSQRASRVAIPISRKVVRDIATGLGQLLRSGMAPAMAFKMVASAAKPRVARELTAVEQRLMAGDTLAEAMEASPRLFRVADRIVVDAFTEVGEPGAGFDAVAAQAEDALDFKRQLVKSSSYPLVILVSHILITPLPSLVLSGTRAYVNAVVWHLALLGAVLAFVVFGLPALLRATPLGDLLKRVAWKLPWPASLWVVHARSVFHRTLSRNLGAGLELFRATRGAAAATADPTVVKRCELMLPEIAQHGFAQPVASAGLLAPSELILVVSGEKSGTLDETLAKVAERYVEARRRGVRWLMMIIGALVGLIVVIVVTMGLISAYRGITSTAESLMNGIDLEAPFKDLGLPEGLNNIEDLDIDALQNMDLEGFKNLPGLNFDVDYPEMRDIEH